MGVYLFECQGAIECFRIFNCYTNQSLFPYSNRTDIDIAIYVCLNSIGNKLQKCILNFNKQQFSISFNLIAACSYFV